MAEHGCLLIIVRIPEEPKTAPPATFVTSMAALNESVCYPNVSVVGICIRGSAQGDCEGAVGMLVLRRIRKLAEMGGHFAMTRPMQTDKGITFQL